MSKEIFSALSQKRSVRVVIPLTIQSALEPIPGEPAHLKAAGRMGTPEAAHFFVS
jgi:hypothetical protein